MRVRCKAIGDGPGRRGFAGGPGSTALPHEPGPAGEERRGAGHGAPRPGAGVWQAGERARRSAAARARARRAAVLLPRRQRRPHGESGGDGRAVQVPRARLQAGGGVSLAGAGLEPAGERTRRRARRPGRRRAREPRQRRHAPGAGVVGRRVPSRRQGDAKRVPARGQDAGFGGAHPPQLFPERIRQAGRGSRHLAGDGVRGHGAQAVQSDAAGRGPRDEAAGVEPHRRAVPERAVPQGGGGAGPAEEPADVRRRGKRRLPRGAMAAGPAARPHPAEPEPHVPGGAALPRAVLQPRRVPPGDALCGGSP
mmetsp:Transcript_32935/g.63263  ORF Transcript_32935/g.63263 Transcript_32935/m.63263 type:complete len:309 (-) Transcript_32935:1576-2502(-)